MQEPQELHGATGTISDEFLQRIINLETIVGHIEEWLEEI